MKLPANCPYLDRWQADRDIMHAYLPKWGPLCGNTKYTVEEYRFILRSCNEQRYPGFGGGGYRAFIPILRRRLV
jgi:hypothetical protein